MADGAGRTDACRRSKEKLRAERSGRNNGSKTRKRVRSAAYSRQVHNTR
ncbi:MAG: hypothetical protein WC620_02885 [Methanoregula sp.]